MKLHFFLLTAFLAACVPALAQNPPTPPTSFEQHKAAMIAKLQIRIGREQSLLSCLQSAQNRAAVKACRRASRPVP